MKKYLLVHITFMLGTIGSVHAQDGLTIRVKPATLSLAINQQATIKAEVVDQNGRVVADRKVAFFTGRQSRRFITVDSTGLVTALMGGNYEIIMISPGKDGTRIRKNYPVVVQNAPISRVEINGVPGKLYAGTTTPISIKVFDAAGVERTDVDLDIKTDDKGVAKLDKYGHLTTMKAGNTTLRIVVKGIEGTVNLKVVKNPATSIELISDMAAARTGDVYHFRDRVMDKNGKGITDAPIRYSFQGESDNPEYTASSRIKRDGRFVADVPGLYNIIATSGSNAAMQPVEVSRRNVSRKIDVTGHGSVNTKHTSDFWIWTGKDGRDYGVTGTW